MFWIAQWWRTRGANFGVVDEGKVYRGAAPTDREIVDMARQFKLRLILDLRAEYGGATPLGVKAVPALNYRHAALEDKPPMDVVDVPRILACAAILADPRSGPTFVHCAGGRHRTGAVVATYQVQFLGWDPKRALDEALEFGLYGAGGHQGYVDYIKGLTPVRVAG